MKQQQGFQLKAFAPMALLSPIPTLLETYDQPFFKKPALMSENLLLQQQLADWVHQIYFDQKKLNELSVLRLIEHPLHAVKPNIKCSIMYAIIRQKVQQVCKQIRQLIIDSYRKLNTKKQTNADLKHSSDSWNVNFSKFRKANIQTGMNKVYGPIAHIVCIYHNSLLDCNTEVYNLWKILYQCSEIKDLEFKTLQGSLNELILDQLMQDYPNNEMLPKDIMPTLSSFEKHEFIFKEMWGFQKRKLAVHFHARATQSTQSDKQRKNSLMSLQNMPKRVQKGQVLSPPKPIPLSLKQIGVGTSKLKKNIAKNIAALKELQRKKAMQEELQFFELQQQFSELDLQTRNKILQHLYDFRCGPPSVMNKEKTLKNIEKIILNITEDENGLLPSESFDPDDENATGEINQDEQNAQSDQDNDHFFYEDDNLIDQENQNDDLLYRMKLRQHKKIEAFQDFNRQWRSKRLQDIKQQQIRTKQTAERYLKLCEKINSIRKTYQGVGIEFKCPKSLSDSAHPFRLTSDEMLDIEALPQLIPIKRSQIQSKEPINDKPDLNIEQREIKSESLNMKAFPEKDRTQKMKNKQKTLKIESSAYSLKLDDEAYAMNNQSLYQKIKRHYETKTYEEFYCDDQSGEEKISKKNNKNKKQSQSQVYFGKHGSISALTGLIANKGKPITQISSKTQKNSNQQVYDQFCGVARQMQRQQKKGYNIHRDMKVTYQKFSCELRSGGQKSEFRVTKGELTNLFDDLSDKAKYHLGQTSEYGEKLIDEPNEDLCQDDKPQKKKKKKKKKKNKQKKQLSEENENNFDKGSNSSINDDEEDLESLQEFKKKSISDLFNLRKMMGWPEGQSLHEYLQSSQRLERQKEQQLLMEKKIEIYEKNGQNEKNNERDRKAASKENKLKRENYNEDEVKLLQFLESLEIKEQNREKCVVTEETLQKIILKRKQIKSLQIFQNVKQREESIGRSMNKNEREKPSESLNEETPKAPKPKNKKKKK